MNFSAIILAGGKSSRMGCDKAFLEQAGQTWLARQLKLVRTVGAREIFISGRPDADYARFGCPVLMDRFPDAGPLAGIERGLAGATTPTLLVLAVDLIAMTPELLRKLVACASASTGVVPRRDGQLEPLAAFYPKTVWSLAESLLKQDQRSVKKLAETAAAAGLLTFMDVAADEAMRFANANLPADLPAGRAIGCLP